VEHQHQNLPDKIWMIMKTNTYGDKVKDLPASQQRLDKHLRLATVVEIHFHQMQSFAVSAVLQNHKEFN
jgi:hypothetical protein